MPFYWLVIGALAVWRVTHLLNAEDGPAGVLVRLRRLAGSGFWGSLLDCFYCLSLWIAAPFAVLLGGTWQERATLWLALSGAACLLERATADKAEAPVVEWTEDSDVLLRERKSTAAPSGSTGVERAEF